MNNNSKPFPEGRIKYPGKILQTFMRIFVLLLGISSVQANSSYAQTTLDIDVDNVSIEELFSEIQSKSEFYFFYKDDIIDKTKKVSIHLQKVTINEILDNVFKDTQLGYKVDNRQVVIRKLSKPNIRKVIEKIQDVEVQSRVTGKVTDVNGGVLPGVNVLIVGTLKGTQTNVDGTYEVEAIPGDELSFSFVGMETQIKKVSESLVVNVSLKESSAVLEELILVAYGEETKESLTGSVSVIRGEDLKQIPVATFEQSLRGTVTGLQASAIDGAPGANTSIRIRGTGSISASSEPLYVVDGVPIQSGDISAINGNDGRSGNVMTAINPNDIESISVLKDAAATAIYGSRGANGVILITTKSGKSGKAKITLSSLVGFNSPAYRNNLEPLNAQQYTQLFLEGWTNRGDTPAQAQQRFENTFLQAIDPVTGDTTDTNWLDAISRVGITQSYDLSASGATDNLKYYFSGSYYDQQSHIIGSDFKRMSARANLEYKANDAITISNNMFISQFVQHTFLDAGSFSNPIKTSLELSPLIPIYDQQGRYNAEHGAYFPYNTNLVGMLSGDDEREIGQIRVMDNFAVAVNFLNDFTFRSQWNFDVISVNEYIYGNARYGYAEEIGGEARNATTLNTSWVGTQTLNYSKALGSLHNIGALLGYEAQESNRETYSAYGNGFPNGKLRTLNSTASEYSVTGARSQYTFAAMFARATYDYNQKYFLSSSIRRDGSSRFGSENRWGTFYSFGGGWVISNEGLLSSVTAIDFLRLRSSWGITGNAEIGDFPSAGLYTYGQDYDGSPGGRPNQIGNPNLTWEKQKNFNVGLDFDVIGKIGGTIEYFKRTSSDLILDVPISLTTGFQTLTQNFGEMVNSGIELTLNAEVIRTPDFLWSVGMNLTFLENEITKLSEDFIDGNFRRQVGEDFQSYYLLGWAGVDQTNGDPLWFTDATKTEVTNNPGNAERFLDGKSATPDYFGGFNSLFSYKGLTLNAQFMYSYGNYLFDERARGPLSDGRLTPRSTALVAFENRWVPGKTDATWPMHRWGGQPGSNQQANSRWLFDGSFLRLKNVTLSYDLSEAMVNTLKVQSLRFYVRGTNLLTFTKEDLYIDPEQSINGVADLLTPAIKTISIGIDVGI